VLPCLDAAPLAWQSHPGYRVAPLAQPPPGMPGFTRINPAQSGVTFTNALAEARHLRSNTLLGGSGVAAGDVDGDGLCDLFFSSLDLPCRLYRNLGNWHFEDITEQAGVGLDGLDATGAVLADFDGDSDLDLIVNNVGSGTHLFLNDGKARFRRATPPRGLNFGRAGTSLAMADVDGDGYLDLYVANYQVRMLMDMPNTYFEFAVVDGKQTIAKVNGKPVSHPLLQDRFVISESGRILDTGEPDILYRNLGGTNVSSLRVEDGHFLDETGRTLTNVFRDFGLSVAFRDLNQDGRPDLYVCNDFHSPDRIWLNQGGLKFKLIDPMALRHTSMFSMGIDFADLNRDGLDDFLVLDMQSRDHEHRMDTAQPETATPAETRDPGSRPQYMFNTLFLNRGDGTYSEIAHLAGLAATEWSWTPVFLDVDLDGWEDVLVSNGYVREARSEDTQKKLQAMRGDREASAEEVFASRRLYPPYASPNLAFRNEHNLHFADHSEAWGFHEDGVSHGMALADLDNDGDLDLAVNNLNAPASLYRNNATAPRLAVQLVGDNANTHGIGARIEVFGGPVRQSQEITCGGRYLSSDQPLRAFAAGSETNTLTLEVRWPDGRLSRVEKAHAHHLYEIHQSAAQPAPETPTPGNTPPLFEDVSRQLAHTHTEDTFDEFARQRLLPRQLGHIGPPVAWADLDGDGHEDLVIGAAHRGAMAVFHNEAGRRLRPWTGSSLGSNPRGDQTALLPVPSPQGAVTLLAAHSPWADGAGSHGSVQGFHLDAQSAAPELRLPLPDTVPGPMAIADIDLDGDLDLFVGGAFVPGRYPLPASSFLFLNDNGRFLTDTQHNERLREFGLVRGAVFSDLDLDDDPDLVVACEWGPVRVLHNDHGTFTEQTGPLGLAGCAGWWTGVTTGDFNEDGRPDIVAANWGRNSTYALHDRNGLDLYYDDLDQNGMIDVIEAFKDEKLGRIVPQHRLPYLAQGLPPLGFRFTSNQDFGRASIEEIMGKPLSSVGHLHANWLESTLFLSSPTGYVARPLPVEAQLAPAFGISVADANGDGHEDLFLAQNFFSTRDGVARDDSGLGRWMLGDGQGNLRPLSPSESGVRIEGEQRGCALGDFDEDGRIDLAVGQNGGATRLFRNATARPGLRVRVQGPPTNPFGVGTILRVGDGKQWGPAREIHAGSGWGSHDSPVMILGHSGQPTQLQVRFPGQPVRTIPIPPEALKDPAHHPIRIQASR